ncbi:hypothetical protein KLQUCP357M_23825 [Klebsiella quasipneumoniae subsp. similipneumoniae]
MALVIKYFAIAFAIALVVVLFKESIKNIGAA